MNLKYLIISRGLINQIPTLSIFFVPLCLCAFTILLTSTAEGQDITEEVQIIGKDTRVFVIAGDRASTVKLISAPVSLPEEKRGIETSGGLIGDDLRLWRRENFEVTEGPFTRADIFLGSRTLTDIWGKASLDKGNGAGTVKVINRQAKEHTQTNMAPTTQEIEGIGYFDVSRTRFSAAFGLAREDDDLSGNRFRSRDREVTQYRGDLSLRTTLLKSLDITSKFNVKGGTYKDFEIPYDENGVIVGGDICAVGDLYDITVVTNITSDFIKLGDDNGSIFSSGIKGQLLLLSNLGFQAGANFYVSAVPDEDAKTRIYPEASLDWAVSKSLFVKVSYKPSVIRNSFGDIYAQNGLVKPVPMLFEDNKTHIDSEIGLRFASRGLISAGMFYDRSERALVFNRSGNFFDVVRNASVELTGFRLRTRYDKEKNWGFNGELFINDSTCTCPVPGGKQSGDTPYIPGVKSVIHGYWVPYKLWTLRTSVNFIGKHSVDITSDDEVVSFLTIDCGVERELWNYLSVYTDIRNITNSEGAWWTNQYGIPGIGLYIGLKARY